MSLPRDKGAIRLEGAALDPEASGTAGDSFCCAHRVVERLADFQAWAVAERHAFRDRGRCASLPVTVEGV